MNEAYPETPQGLRYLSVFLCVCALGALPLASVVGCGDEV